MPITKLTPENNYPYQQERLKALEQAVPEAFADGKINWDTLREVLGEDLEDGAREEFFGLTWPGKREARKRAAIPSRGTLVPVPGEGVNEDETENLFIEGDNLEVLKLLQKSYAGKIKMIYIDPPYNTGNDFIYNDDFTDPLEAYLQYTGAKGESGDLLTTNTRSEGRYHSRWLNFIYPRLVLAKSILSNNGLIVIHIDEHEYSSLSLLMNEIYGEENNLGTIIWDKKNPKGDATGIASQHESIIVFAKNKEVLLQEHQIQRAKKNAQAILRKAKELYSRLGKVCLPDELQKCIDTYGLPESIVKNQYRTITLGDINKEFSTWIKAQGFSGGETAYSLIDENGEVYRPVSMAWPNKKRAPEEYFIPLIHPITKKSCPLPARGWRNPPATMKKLLDEGLILFGPDETTQPVRKYFLSENMNESIPSILPFGGSDDALLNSLGIPFDNPKPVEVSKQLIQAFSSTNAVIMDFFAGSCTTAHAVLETNMQEGSNRKFLVIQLPETTDNPGFPSITEIGKERIHRAIEKLNKDFEDKVKELPLLQTDQKMRDLGFKVYKYSRSNFKQWKPTQSENEEALTSLFDNISDPLIQDWKKEDLLSEILLLEGFPLTSKLCYFEDLTQNQVYKVIAPDFCEYNLFVYLDGNIHPATIDLLKMEDEDIFVCLDSALSDELKARLQDQFNVHVI